MFTFRFDTVEHKNKTAYSVDMETVLDPVNDGVRTYPDGSDINLTASALVKTGSGRIQGIIINSHTAGTIKLWDNTVASGTVICNTMTLAVGERYINLFGASFGTGLFVTIGGTADITVVYN